MARSVVKMECCHDYVYEQGGFFTCRHCGTCSDDPILDFHVPFEDNPNPSKRPIVNMERRLVRKLELYRLGTIRSISDVLYHKLSMILNALPLNDAQKKEIKKHVLRKKPKRVKDLYVLIAKLIIEKDMPVTTGNLIETFNEFDGKKKRFHVLRMFDYNKHRPYRWFMLKTLDGIEGLKSEDKFKAYLYTCEHYDKITRASGKNPIKVIKFLIYKYLNEHCTYVKKTHRSLKAFGFTSHYRLK